MKKAALILALLAGIAALLVCSGNSVSPLSDSYNQKDLFKAEVIADYDNGFGEVRIYWLVEKMSQGNSPFSFGPLDDEWTAANKTPLSTKTSDGKFYTYSKTVQFGQIYGVGGGLNSSGNNIGSYRWLTPNEQAGCDYFNPATGNMAFIAYSNFTVHHGR